MLAFRVFSSTEGKNRAKDQSLRLHAALHWTPSGRTWTLCGRMPLSVRARRKSACMCAAARVTSSAVPVAGAALFARSAPGSIRSQGAGQAAGRYPTSARCRRGRPLRPAGECLPAHDYDSGAKSLAAPHAGSVGWLHLDRALGGRLCPRRGTGDARACVPGSARAGSRACDADDHRGPRLPLTRQPLPV